LKLAIKKVYVAYKDKEKNKPEIREELLIIIKESKNKYKYALSNLDINTSIEKIAYYKAHRYFIERVNQEAKSELGWDEFQGQKYLGWSHHLAMTILASWFITYVKLQLQNDLEKENLKESFLLLFSVSNIKKLLLSVIPFKNITPEIATKKVLEDIEKRNNSRQSRLRKQEKERIKEVTY
jgi:valyl-tRNA synthetase